MDIKFPSGGIVDLAAGVTGVLPVANGGSGVSTSTGSTNVVLSGSPTITTPVIAQINDANGNETLKLASIASAVNEVTIENAATGSAVHISATGGDASVGLHLAGKGASGYVNVQDSVDATKRIMFNASGGTTNTRTMLSSTQTVDRTISLPDATDTLVGKATTDTLTNKTLTSPTLTTPALGTPASGTLTSCTGLPLTTGVTGILPAANGGTGIANNAAMTVTGSGNFAYTRTLTAATNVTFPTTGTLATLAGSETFTNKTLTSPTLTAPVLGTPASGTVTNLTGTASININGTVGATTPSTGAFTTVGATGDITASGGNILSTAGVQIPIRVSGATTGGTVLRLENTGGQSFFGAEGTNTSNFIVGCTAYDTIVRGPSGIAFSANAGNAMQMRISSAGAAVTGAITATGNITAYYSDDRLKTKLGNIENALDKVCSLDGFYYEANETAQALGYKPVREVGLSAQSVQKVLPEVIAPAPIDSQYLTMHYERVVPLLVEAIKELRAEIASLRK